MIDAGDHTVPLRQLTSNTGSLKPEVHDPMRVLLALEVYLILI